MQPTTRWSFVNGNDNDGAETPSSSLSCSLSLSFRLTVRWQSPMSFQVISFGFEAGLWSDLGVRVIENVCFGSSILAVHTYCG